MEGPDWIDNEHYDVDATMPPETTREQVQVMLQNLLAERFKMTVRRAGKELPIYALVVAKNGPKLKDSTDKPYDSSPPPPRSSPRKPGPDGFPPLEDVAGHRGMFTARGASGSRIIAQQQGMAELAGRLSTELGQIVRDETGLNAKYDFTLTFSHEFDPKDPPPFPDLFAAVQSQLGLKLESRKAPVPVIIVEQAQKIPVEN